MAHQKRYVIYTALVGAYDTLRQPMVVDERFDYVLFCNEVNQDSLGVWKVRPIAYHNNDSTRICRYIKTHPAELVGDYEVSVWMDASMQIQKQEFYDLIVGLDKEGVKVSSMWHYNECIYKEAFDVTFMMVEHEKVVVEWCHKMRTEGYPRYNGLCETGVMYRRHKDGQVMNMSKLWWHCIDKYSKRDQLSFNYAIWKSDLPLHYMLGKGNSVRNTEYVNLQRHDNMQHNRCPIGDNEAWLMRYCWKDKSQQHNIEEIYFKLYAWPCTKLVVNVVGQWYRLKYLLHGKR